MRWAYNVQFALVCVHGGKKLQNCILQFQQVHKSVIIEGQLFQDVSFHLIDTRESRL